MKITIPLSLCLLHSLLSFSLGGFHDRLFGQDVTQDSLNSLITKEDSKLRPLNNISFNLFGNASFVSINYERIFLSKRNFFVATAIGVGTNQEFYINMFGDTYIPHKYITIPYRITANIGNGKHFFEFGMGATLIHGITTQP